MLTATAIIAVAAFVITILSAMGKAPLWVAVFLLAFLHVLAALGS